MSRRQIGVFSGSFNPIHIGHLILASYIKEFTYIDDVWLLVTPHNPLKDASDLLDDKIRLKLAQMAVEDYDRISVSDFEFDMPTPSYTIDTLDKLSEKYPEYDFTLIIGGDNWNDFHKWKNYELLLDKYKIIIYPRAGEDIIIEDSYKNSVEVVDAPIVEVSSTFIRNSIKNGKDIRAFVPSNIYDYIINNKYYQ